MLEGAPRSRSGSARRVARTPADADPALRRFAHQRRKLDYVERPMGLDAVVVALFRRRPARWRCLLSARRARFQSSSAGRRSHRPCSFGAGAGILRSPGDDVFQRAADEAMEEAGLRVRPGLRRDARPRGLSHSGNVRRGFQFVCCEVAPEKTRLAHPPRGDGSPFEKEARLEGRSAGALARAARSGT